jgi:TatD DNase family protein
VIFDPHCHLDDPELAPVLEQAVETSLSAGVSGALIPGYGPERWPRQTDLLLRQGRFSTWGAFGLHPWAVDPNRDLEPQLAELEKGWCQHAERWGDRLKAIGEFGLDRSRHGQHVPMPLQQRLFSWHLRRAEQTNLPLILHLVKADGAALKLLSEGGPWKGVVHAFSSHQQTMAGYAQLGLSFSYGSALLRSDKVRESLRATAEDRLMFETDAPQGLGRDFSSPRGPHHLLEIVRAASQVLGKSVEYLLARHRENCARVFAVGSDELMADHG